MSLISAFLLSPIFYSSYPKETLICKVFFCHSQTLTSIAERSLFFVRKLNKNKKRTIGCVWEKTIQGQGCKDNVLAMYSLCIPMECSICPMRCVHSNKEGESPTFCQLSSCSLSTQCRSIFRSGVSIYPWILNLFQDNVYYIVLKRF